MAKAPDKADIVDDFKTAAWQDEVDTLRALASRYPFLVDPREPYLVEALHRACNSCQQEAARVLVEEFHADVNAVPDAARGMTALHEALNSCDAVTARMLVENGADVNKRETSVDSDTGGWTALHYAVSQKDTALAGFLIGHGADPGIKDDAGKSAVDLARATAQPKLAAELGPYVCFTGRLGVDPVPAEWRGKAKKPRAPGR
ncbi:MAG: ankyrin repeat domain-containing protein [Alphaproteobacteria bacterium]